MKLKNPRPIFLETLFIIGWLACATGPLFAANRQSELAQKIINEPAFPYRLVWAGDQTPSENESQALWDALQIMRETGVRAGITRLELFVAANPHSPWTPALQSNLAQFYRRHGRYSLALPHWEGAWEATKEFKDGQGKAVADMTLAYWTPLLASLGQLETLSRLLDETKGRALDNGAFEARFNATREAVAGMIQKPGISYGCGTYAVYNVLRTFDRQNSDLAKIAKIPFFIASI